MTIADKQIRHYIDFSKLRLGDRMAAVWYAQQRRASTGERFGVVDRYENLNEPFNIEKFFPSTFVAVTEEEVQRCGLEEWDQGVLWITAANAFSKNPVPGAFEHIPAEVKALADDIASAKRTGHPRVLVHVLDDAQYNDRRNWTRKDADALAGILHDKGCDVQVLNPVKGKFAGNFSHMLAEMLAADAFIGGDTGPSHVFAMLCPDKPQLAIYPDMSHDRKTYEPVQRALNLPLPWTSLPLKKNLAVLQLKPARAWTLKGWRPKRIRLGRFNPLEAANMVLSLLYPRHEK